MDSIRVVKIDLKDRKYSITLPASKSMANRAFILAAQTAGEYRIEGGFGADDIQLMMGALKKLGIGMLEDGAGVQVVNDMGWIENKDDIELFLGNSGTSIRFLSSLLCLRKGKTVLTGVQRMKERPIVDLVDALRELGADIEYLERSGYPSIRISGGTELGSKVSIKGNTSSQYISSLMLISSSLPKGLEISVDGKLISMPYV